jgi:hypothetical protein
MVQIRRVDSRGKWRSFMEYYSIFFTPSNNDLPVQTAQVVSNLLTRIQAKNNSSIQHTDLMLE